MAATQTGNTSQGFDTMTMVRQLLLLVAMAGSIAIGGWLVFWLQEPNYGVLFSSLDDGEASLILEELQKLDIPHKLDSGTGALLVPTKEIHSARIKLAAQGLPKGTRGGLFGSEDSGGFGVSEAMEKVRFQKALESELAITIGSLANVKNVRIHLAIPKQSVFVRNRHKPRASVVINLYAGRNLTDGQVAAVVHLVSSSVPNLDVENVTVVDQKGHLLTAGEASREMALSSTQFDYTQRLEKSFMERVENILVPILGADAVRAQVTADIDFTYSEQTQESFNPDSLTPRSVQSLEEQSNGSSSGGVPGALSNQPPGKSTVPEQAAGASDKSGGANSRSSRRETKNYELDKTISHTRFAMGRLRRLSVAVVLDDMLTTGEDGKTIRTERSPEEIDRITTLVKKAIGFNLQRGDSVNVINAAFTQPDAPVELPATPIWEQPWVWDVSKHVVGVLLVLVIAFGVLRPVFRSITATIQPIMAAPPALPRPAGEIADDTLSLGGSEQKKLAGPATPFEKNMQTAQQTVVDDPKLVAQVVKNWVTDNG